MNFTSIEKELVPSLKFWKDEVIADLKIQKERNRKLKTAELLGNTHKRKAKIVFKTMEGLYRVETTVWAKTEKFVALKGGVLIPVACILAVDFF